MALRVALATATMALPHVSKIEGSKRERREPMAMTTTHVETAVAIPPQYAYDSLIREAAERYGVDAILIKAVVEAESAFNALAVSRAGAQGLMQLTPTLAAELNVDDPFDPRQNVMAGARHLRRLLDLFDGNVRLALASYNAGIASVSQHRGVPPFRETRNYVKRVTALVKESQRIDND